VVAAYYLPVRCRHLQQRCADWTALTSVLESRV
jgi:hypothetical protein